MLAPTVAICVQVPVAAGARWILKPCSLLELSFQVRFIWLEETAAAVGLLGAAGAVSLPAHAVVAVDTASKAESRKQKAETGRLRDDRATECERAERRKQKGESRRDPCN